MALKMPHKHLLPSEMTEAILVAETGFTPAELTDIPEPVLERLLIYRGVKNVLEYGGEYNG